MHPCRKLPAVDDLPGKPGPRRRDVLGYLNVGAAGAVGLCVGIPAARYLAYPAGADTVTDPGEPIVVASVADIETGVPMVPIVPLRVPIRAASQTDAWTRHDDVALGAAWLVRNDGELTAFSATCPHLGCSVGWDPSDQVFRCPCHTSAFSPRGERLAGPARRGLDPLPLTVRDGRVYLRYQRFALDVPERRPV